MTYYVIPLPVKVVYKLFRHLYLSTHYYCWQWVCTTHFICFLRNRKNYRYYEDGAIKLETQSSNTIFKFYKNTVSLTLTITYIVWSGNLRSPNIPGDLHDRTHPYGSIKTNSKETQECESVSRDQNAQY